VTGRVLVVDDNKVIRQLIRVNLELEGFEVVTAADGAECLDVIHRVRPDLVTLDVVMPRLDGLRTAAQLRSDARTRHLPLVIVSACTQYEVESGLDVGVDAFLAKPFEPSELVGLVRQLMEGQGSVRAIGPKDSGADVGRVPGAAASAAPAPSAAPASATGRGSGTGRGSSTGPRTGHGAHVEDDAEEEEAERAGRA
jgi:CheY-like chemotaxis protein